MLHAELGRFLPPDRTPMPASGYGWRNGLDVDEFLNHPSLYQNDQNNWLFFHGQGRGSLIFYDYQTNHWMSVDLD